MSKTFKNRVSVRDAESVLEITDTPAGVRITVSEENRIVSGWFNPGQGAEIALAILEAAGVEESSPHYGLNDSPEWNLRWASHYLGRSIELTNTQAAEAEAQAKLKAEALRLANEFYGTDWDYFPCSRTVEMQQWLAVARRAREIAKEATNGR